MPEDHLLTELKNIECRVGDYHSFVQLLQKVARDYAIPDGKFKGNKAFDKVDLDNDDSFLNSIFKSWAAVLEVLSFYQERNLNEGYINTAKEIFSIHQLVSAIGYRQNPNLSAQTWLAFNVQNKSTLNEFIIPNGTQVQNIPDKGMPAIFETIEDFSGSPDWNEIHLNLISTNKNYLLRASASFCQIKTSTSYIIKKGTHLLIQATLNNHPVTYFVEITKITQHKEGFVIAYWDHCLDIGNALLEKIQIYVAPFMSRAFAFNSASWADTSEKIKQSVLPSRAGIICGNTNSNLWQAYTPSPPSGDIQNIIELGQGHFVVAGNSGIWLSEDNGINWQKSPAKNILGNILCMIIGDNGTLYAGSTQGAVYSSVDLGFTWLSISGRTYFNIEEKKSVSVRLPKVRVNSIISLSVTYKNGLTRAILFCATSQGIFYTLDGGLAWYKGDDLFSYHDQIMATGLWAYELKIYNDIELYVATEKGFYYATINEKSLHEKADRIKRIPPSFLSRILPIESTKDENFIHNNEHTTVYCSLSMIWNDENIILLSTEKGLHRLHNKKWTAQNQGLITQRDGSYPRFYSFHLDNDIIYGISDLGIYLSWDSGITWELQGNSLVATLPDLLLWRKYFDQNKFPPDFQSVMQQYGYYFTNNSIIETNSTENTWFIHDTFSSVVAISKNGRELHFDFGCSEEKKLVLKEQNYYTGLLISGEKLALEWRELLKVYGVNLSKKSWVTDYPNLGVKVIQDEQTYLTLLIYISVEKIEIFHLEHILSLTKLENNLFLATTKQAFLALNNWPDYLFEPSIISLEKAVSTDKIGDLVYLTQQNHWPTSQLCSVQQAKMKMMQALDKKARTTELQLDTSLLQKFDRNSLKIYIGLKLTDSAEYLFYDHSPPTASSLKLLGDITPMKQGHMLSIEGARATVQIIKKFNQPENKEIIGQEAKSGYPTVLKRPFIVSVNASDYIDSIRAGFIEHKLSELLIKHGVILSASTFLQHHTDDCWSLIDETDVSYYFEYIAKTTSLQLFREFYFPVITVYKDRYKLLYNEEEVIVPITNELQFSWIRPDKTIPLISEVACLADFNRDRFGHVSIQLLDNLKHLYAPNTIRIKANLIHAVQAESITKEVIGSSDQTKTFQRFKLLHNTFACYENEQGDIKNFLTIFTRRSQPWGPNNDDLEEWRQIDSIFNAGANERCYQLEIAADGYAYISFGDGVFGQRSPTGIENVMASYRKGGGSIGNVAANTLKILRSKPRCVKAVTNPVAAVGGADATPVNHIRYQAPQSLHNTGVIVSEEDYLYFARDFSGVKTVYLNQLKIRNRDNIILTIIPHDDQEPASVCVDLKKAIKHYQANKIQIEVLPAIQKLFNINIKISATDNTDWLTLQNYVKTALAKKYSLANRLVGDPIESSEIISFVQSIPGVNAVDLQDLSFTKNHAKTNQCKSKLVALPASYDVKNKHYLGAQVLISFDHYISVIIGEIS